MTQKKPVNKFTSFKMYPEPESNRHDCSLVFETSASTNSAIRAFNWAAMIVKKTFCKNNYLNNFV